jgi:transcriptional regulator with XRE-family HTH domain
MDEVTTTRHRVLVKRLSQREVARRLGMSRKTVRRYVEGAPVGERRPAPRDAPKLAAVRDRLESLLRESPRWTAGKQRLTATQLWRMVWAEGHAVGLTLVKR